MPSHTPAGRATWRCLLCGEELNFHAHDEQYIGFFAVHHLHRRHGMSREEVLAYDASLADALREYRCCDVASNDLGESLV